MIRIRSIGKSCLVHLAVLVAVATAWDGVGAEAEVRISDARTFSGLEENRCDRFYLYERPEWLKGGRQQADLAWTTSLAWVGSHLFLADVAFSRIAEVTPDGEVETVVERKQVLQGIKSGSFFVSQHPRFIYSLGDQGYLLLDYYNGIVLLDQEHRVKKGPIGTLERVLTDEVTLMFVHRFVPWRNGVLTYSDLAVGAGALAERKQKGAFVYLGFDGSHEIFEPDSGIAMDSLVRYLFLRDFSYLAAIDNKAFVLMMEKEPWIGRIEPGDPIVRPLPDFPEDFRPMPAIDRTFWLRGAARALKAYQVVENSTMPIGLYAWADRLYLLVKSARSHGKTDWWLIEIDQTNGRQLSKYRLPTEASHVVLAPGSLFGFVEKGPIDKGGKPDDDILIRKAYSVVLFPSKWLVENREGHFEAKDAADCRDQLGH